MPARSLGELHGSSQCDKDTDCKVAIGTSALRESLSDLMDEIGLATGKRHAVLYILDGLGDLFLELDRHGCGVAVDGGRQSQRGIKMVADSRIRLVEICDCNGMVEADGETKWEEARSG